MTPRLGGVMLYYFNIIDGPTEILDPEGTELPSEEAAQSEATAIAAELVQEFPRSFGPHSILEAISAEGRRVMALPLHSHIFTAF